jgi:hypothetical protein
MRAGSNVSVLRGVLLNDTVSLGPRAAHGDELILSSHNVRLNFLELVQHGPGKRNVETVSRHFLDDGPLPGDRLLALLDEGRGPSQMSTNGGLRHFFSCAATGWSDEAKDPADVPFAG